MRFIARDGTGDGTVTGTTLMLENWCRQPLGILLSGKQRSYGPAPEFALSLVSIKVTIGGAQGLHLSPCLPNPGQTQTIATDPCKWLLWKRPRKAWRSSLSAYVHSAPKNSMPMDQDDVSALCCGLLLVKSKSQTIKHFDLSSKVSKERPLSWVKSHCFLCGVQPNLRRYF